jgi:type IV secretion system protein VirB5
MPPPARRRTLALGTPSFYPPSGDNHSRFTSDPADLALADTINGRAQKNARTWQIVALVSLSSFFISLGILGYAVTLPKTVPVIVTVNPEGRAQYVGRVDRSMYSSTASVPEAAKLYSMRRLLTTMHTWVIDRDAQEMFIREAQSLVQSGAISQLDLFFRANNPFTGLGEITRSIEIDPPLKQTETTYIAYFTTAEKDRNGYTRKIARWSALINLDLFETTEQNPLGLYIVNFDIKQAEEKR